MGAFLREARRDRETDAAASAGDDSDLFNFDIVRPPVEDNGDLRRSMIAGHAAFGNAALQIMQRLANQGTGIRLGNPQWFASVACQNQRRAGGFCEKIASNGDSPAASTRWISAFERTGALWVFA
jgi:hypothetical protein